MYKKAALLLAPLLVVAIAGCTQDQVVGRYKSALCETDVLPAPIGVALPTAAMPSAAPSEPCAKVTPTASASVDSIPTPPSSITAVTGTSLPERAQARYIAELAKYSKSAEDLRGNLAAKITSHDAASGVDNRTVFHRTLVVSVRKDGGFNPADRLEATDVLIRPSSDVRFDNWDTLATIYTTVNAGTVQLTQARGLTENLTAGAPSGAPVSGSLSLGGSQTDTRVENLSALSTRESLTATIEDGALRIRRQGGYGIDLTGNTIIKVDLSYAGNPELLWLFSAKSYVDKNGHWLPTNKVSLTGKPVMVLPWAKPLDIDADVFLTYTIRHVSSGGKTYEEKDDDILERTIGPVYQKIVLVPARQALPPIFGVHVNGKVVEIAAPGLRTIPLCFDAYTDALNFMAYMRAGNVAHPDRIGNAMLRVPDPERGKLAPLTRPDLDDAQVQPTCT
jgi:hypothetical protein